MRLGLVLLLLAPYAGIPGAEPFSDCEACPEMVIIPAGTGTLGEAEPSSGRRFGWGGPPVTVSIQRNFALSRHETTRAQFARFVEATGYAMDAPCTSVWQAIVGADARPSWRDPLYPEGVKQDGDHPVVCVGWHDAQAYIAWLNGLVDGRRIYYLPSEAEWEYAARGGDGPVRPWKGGFSAACRHANVGDRRYFAAVGSESIDCDDGFPFSSPVGRFPPNGFGLFDMLGNAWEWTHDCWHPDHGRATGSGTPLIRGGDCTKRVMKGAGFSSEAFYLTAATRGADPVPGTRLVLLGFRVAATVD